jgi:hypothetical protein
MLCIDVKNRLIAAGIAFTACFASTTAAAPTQSVTMTVDRFFDSQYGVWRLRFTGVIPGGADEYVAIMHQKCGYRFSTSVGGATTREGGSYEALPMFGVIPQSGTFRAQWKGRLSEPVTLRSPVTVRLNKLPARRFRVIITAEMNLKGRFVALQRLRGGQWRHVRRLRLETGGTPGYTGYFKSEFTVRQRGLRLRVWAPASAVGACHDPSASETFVS